MKQELHIVVLAAGEGKRMASALPKVLQKVAGKAMITHLLENIKPLNADQVHIVHGWQGQVLKKHLSDEKCLWVHQAEQLGTAHAVSQALPGIPDKARVIVLYGDTPFVSIPDLESMLLESVDLCVLSMKLSEPRGYGRILRDDEKQLTGIVEEKDASDEQKRIQEVNSGIMCFQLAPVKELFTGITSNNAQQEFYLTDLVALGRNAGLKIKAVCSSDAGSLLGANNRQDLVKLENRYRMKKTEELLAAGVQLIDPERTEIRGELQCGRDVIIDINVIIEGKVTLGDGVRLGAGVILKDCDIGAGSVIEAYSVVEGASVMQEVRIGPFARIRPGSELELGSRVGNFVEIKNARLGSGSKVNHLSYVGDASVGDNVNIGAGTITCNYDGANKHQTIIGDDVFVGSNTALVAPVEIGPGATIGAGSTITRNVAEKTLNVARASQKEIRGWRRPKKTLQ